MYFALAAFCKPFKSTLQCIHHWWVSIPRWWIHRGVTTPRFWIHQEFQLPSSEYTGKLIMNTNKSFKIWKNLKFFLCVSNGTTGLEEVLWWKNQSKKSRDTVPVRDFLLYFFFIKNNFSCSRYTCLRRFWIFSLIYGVIHIYSRWRGKWGRDEVGKRLSSEGVKRWRKEGVKGEKGKWWRGE